MAENYKLSRDDAALLVIDIQERLIPAMHNPKQLLKQASVLLIAASTFGLPVVATEQYPKGLGGTIEPIVSLLRAEGISGGEIFEKMHFTAAVPAVNAYLRQTGRQQIIITGAETHVCVFQTVRDLLGQGYEVFVPYDAVDSRTEENRDAAFALFREMGAVVTSTETIIFDLLEKAGTPEFKALSPLIK